MNTVKNIFIVIIIVGLLGVIGYCGYQIVDRLNGNNTETKENKTEEKKEKENNVAEDSTNNEEDEVTYDPKFPGFKRISTKEEGSATIKMNSKDKTISITHTNDNGATKVTVKVDDVVSLEGVYGIGEYIYYRTIKGNDNKEYLIIGNWYLGDYFAIYDDELNKIYEISSRTESKDEAFYCNILLENENLLSIENNTMYFYRYVKGSKNDSTNKISVEKVKLSINNSTVSEEPTGTVITAGFGECYA